MLDDLSLNLLKAALDSGKKRMIYWNADWVDDENIDANIVLELWNDVSEDLLELLLDAFHRFKSTVQYRNLELPLTY